MNSHDINRIGVATGAINSYMTIREINKRYPNNKTIKKDLVTSLILTAVGFFSIAFLIVLFLIIGIHWLYSILIGFTAGTIILITTIIVNMKVTRAGLSVSERIILNEGYGQFVHINGNYYFTEYTKPHTREEATKMVRNYLDGEKTITNLHIYKLLDIKKNHKKEIPRKMDYFNRIYN